MFKTNYSHPEQIKQIKSDSQIFQTHLRKLLHHKDYSNLEILMKWYRIYMFDAGIFDILLDKQDYRALKIVIKGIISYELTTTYGNNNVGGSLNLLMKQSVKRLDLTVVNMLLEECFAAQINIASFNSMDGNLRVTDLLRKQSFSKKEFKTKTKEIIKSFVLAVHQQNVQVKALCFESLFNNVDRCKIRAEEDSKLLKEGEKRKSLISCLEEPNIQQPDKANGNCSLHIKPLTAQHLRGLSYYMAPEEFDHFVEEQKINITKFNITFDHYELRKKNPLVSLKKIPESIEDVLLQRTYSDQVNASEAREVYSSLLKSKDFIVRQTMKMFVLNVMNGDDVQVIFTDAGPIYSFYNLYENMITVGTKRTGHCISTSSAAIHEIGHHVIHRLYDLSSTPFSFDASHISNCSSTFLYKLEYVLYCDSLYFGIRDTLSLKENEKLTFKSVFRDFDLIPITPILDKLQDYEEGVKRFLSYTLNLLQIKDVVYELDKHLSTKIFLDYAKDSAPALDLFLVSMVLNNFIDPPRECFSPIKDNVYHVYAQGIGFDVCPTNTTNLHKHPLAVSVEWITKYAFDRIVKKYELSPNQACLLERTADFVSRYNNYDQDELMMYRELIVRYAELQVLGIGSTELKGAFAGTLSFWEKHISPDIQVHISNYTTECAKLSVFRDQVLKEGTEYFGDCCSEKLPGIEVAAKHCELFSSWDQL